MAPAAVPSTSSALWPAAVDLFQTAGLLTTARSRGNPRQHRFIGAGVRFRALFEAAVIRIDSALPSSRIDQPTLGTRSRSALSLLDLGRPDCPCARERRRPHRDHGAVPGRSRSRQKSQWGARNVACRMSAADTHIASTAAATQSFEAVPGASTGGRRRARSGWRRTRLKSCQPDPPTNPRRLVYRWFHPRLFSKSIGTAGCRGGPAVRVRWEPRRMGCGRHGVQ